jgi:hypothetical protein
MSALTVHGICVGLKNEIIKYTKDGEEQEFQSIGASFADMTGIGEPIDVEMTETQQKQLQAFKEYRMPVEARAVTTKRGTFCRISVPDDGVIERLSGGVPTAQNNAVQQAAK